MSADALRLPAPHVYLTREEFPVQQDNLRRISREGRLEPRKRVGLEPGLKPGSAHRPVAQAAYPASTNPPTPIAHG